MDPLSVLRDYAARNELDKIIFSGDDYTFPANPPTAFTSKQSNRPYPLSAAVFLAQHHDLKHTDFIQAARLRRIPPVSLPDRKTFLDFLRFGHNSLPSADPLLPSAFAPPETHLHPPSPPPTSPPRGRKSARSSARSRTATRSSTPAAATSSPSSRPPCAARTSSARPAPRTRRHPPAPTPPPARPPSPSHGRGQGPGRRRRAQRLADADYDLQRQGVPRGRGVRAQRGEDAGDQGRQAGERHGAEEADSRGEGGRGWGCRLIRGKGQAGFAQVGRLGAGGGRVCARQGVAVQGLALQGSCRDLQQSYWFLCALRR
ncbi:hypothetical protein PVAP13_4KG341900 [Panicum virgatum]|uniref:Paf1 complex subunit Cdc73 N-terminal domain-containing protein n=1 Tax=Panicum virgatum TaxID=38727 RepID=A0A8T0TVR5_PANVG|nr:hypothetical protein PVAP13_4KG341900 [Panicum virgatum]KAG2613316.1 hypothetical protein PVAP13_4KG341900 [Panicum virgatum]